MQPTQDELRKAFKAGFQSIDEGDGFYTGFHSHLEASGYQRAENAVCTCSDRGEHGHQPECRWLKN